jgi:hypothetical protein
MKEPMIARCAYVYVRLLLALAILLFAASLLMHLSVLMGAEGPYTDYGGILFAGAVIAGIPTAAFQKSANIWKNEIKTCPGWMRNTFVIFGVYGLVVLCLQLIIFSNGDPLPRQALTVSAIPLALNALSVCILYSNIRSGFVDKSELVRRARNSAIIAALGVTIFLAYRVGYLHHPGK